ncbi:hypothetical protein OH76DRAFT_743544 [Lentinus brumalis]|uniref:Uncharacterized protein n=1 Tax=Lentinus brumalis TaxID=2498619 RepID=A0A371DSK2_9APHY|nr:hypothetical protein OH76DRAFT_743544 [Polyporus brumalis]
MPFVPLGAIVRCTFQPRLMLRGFPASLVDTIAVKAVNELSSSKEYLLCNLSIGSMRLPPARWPTSGSLPPDDLALISPQSSTVSRTPFSTTLCAIFCEMNTVAPTRLCSLTRTTTSPSSDQPTRLARSSNLALASSLWTNVLVDCTTLSRRLTTLTLSLSRLSPGLFVLNIHRHAPCSLRHDEHLPKPGSISSLVKT